MKFSWVSFSEDSSTRLYQMCGQILTFLEKKHSMVTTSNRISCMSIHWATTTSQPNQTEKKTLFTMAPLNYMHNGHRSYFTILRKAAVSSTIILPLPSNQSFDQITSTNTTEFAASANTVNRTVSSSTTDGTAKTLLLLLEQIQLMRRSQKYLLTIQMRNEWQVVSKEKKNI